MKVYARWFFIIAGCAAVIVTTAVAAEQAPAARRAWTVEEQAVIDAVEKGPVGIEDEFDAWAGGYAEDWSYWRLGADEIREREPHMALVKDYIDSGARVEAFEMTPVDVIIHGDAALLRLNARETLRESDGVARVVRYSSAAFLIREDGVWRLAASNLFYPPPETE